MKIIVFILLCGITIGCSSPSTEIIRTSDGDLKGYEQEGVNYFLGIPFAEAPVGDLDGSPLHQQKNGRELEKQLNLALLVCSLPILEILYS